MPDDYDDEMPEPESETPPERKPNFRRELERKAADAEARATQLQRENAIYKAGMNGLNEDQIQVLSGRLTDDLSAEAITAQAERLGWKTGPDVSPETVAAHEAIDRASAGAGATPPEDPREAMRKAMEEGGIPALMAAAQAQGIPTSWDPELS